MASAKNPIVVLDNVRNTIKVNNKDDGYLYTAQKAEAGFTVKEENKDDITTESRDESNAQFDYDSDSSFNNDVDGNKDKQDKDME